MNLRKTGLIAGLAMAAAPHFAAAQPTGDAKAGLAVANGICAECHAVHRDEAASPHGRAPTFEAVANTRGMTELALRVWFQTPHPSMPNLRLEEKQADDVIAYILSLKKR